MTIAQGVNRPFLVLLLCLLFNHTHQDIPPALRRISLYGKMNFVDKPRFSEIEKKNFLFQVPILVGSQLKALFVEQVSVLFNKEKFL